MALQQQVVNVPTKTGSLRATGRATVDTEEVAALLVGVVVQTDLANRLKGSGTTARAVITAGVVTVDVDGPLTAAGDVAVVITIDA